MIYIVTYNLSEYDRNYALLDARLRICGEVLPFQDAACLLSSEMSPREIREAVRDVVWGGDSFFIADMTNGRWAGLNTRLSAWVQEQRGET